MNKLHEPERTIEPLQLRTRYGGAGDALTEARKRLPLDRLMAQHGYACPVGKKSDFKCPACHKKKASLWEHSGQLWFKCFSPHCPTRTFAPHAAFNEERFLGFVLGLSSENGRPGHYSDAAIAYIREAGVWQDRSHNLRTQ